MGLMKWLGLDDCKKEPLSLNDDNFKQEATQSDLPVLIDVWSEGCAPCTALAPTIMRLACKYEGKIKVCHLNTGAAPKTIGRLGVRGTPTVLFMKSGAVVERVVGLRGQHFYEDIIENDLLGGTPAASVKQA